MRQSSQPSTSGAPDSYARICGAVKERGRTFGTEQTIANRAPKFEPAVPSKTKLAWFTAIRTRDQALGIVNAAAMIFFLLAALQAVLGFGSIASMPASEMGYEALLSGVVCAGLALWLMLRKSRTAAIILLIITAISMAIVITSKLPFITVVLVAIALYVAAKATEATFKLRSRFGPYWPRTYRRPNLCSQSKSNWIGLCNKCARQTVP